MLWVLGGKRIEFQGAGTVAVVKDHEKAGGKTIPKKGQFSCSAQKFSKRKLGRGRVQIWSDVNLAPIGGCRLLLYRLLYFATMKIVLRSARLEL